MKRIMSMVIVLCMITGMMASMPLSAFAEETVTRAEWIGGIVETFSMSVEDDSNLPDNYFGDITEDMECYYNILLAVEFGVINLEAGEDFNPDDPATREFAAQTLNQALGFQLGENPEYTYAEASTVAFPDDIQVAVNRGWFALSNGSFLPTQNITTAERDKMLSDARTILEDSVVDENYESTYEFAEGVVVVPDGTDVSITEDNTVTITDYETGIKAGDTFVVFSNGIPVPLVAESLSVTGNITTITATKEGAENAILSVDSEGSAEPDLENFVAEDVETFSVTNNETAETELLSVELQGISYDKKTKTLKADKKIKIDEGTAGSISVKISNIKLEHKEKTSTGVYEAYLTGNTTVTKSISFDLSGYSGLPTNILIGYVPLEGIGDIRLEVKINLEGGLSDVQEGTIKLGYSYKRGGNFRIISNYNKKSYSFTAEAKVTIGLKLSLNLDLVVVTGSLWGTVGVKGTFHHKNFQQVDGKRPYTCTTIKSWLYAEVGGYVSINYFIDKHSWSSTHTIFDEMNSPSRSYYHYEDGEPVAYCTRSKDNNSAYTRYTTKASSRYFNPSPGYARGSYTDEYGNPVVIWEYSLEGSNATITKYNGSAATVVIPNEIDGHKITKIGDNAFFDNPNLHSVIMSDNITEVGSYGFGLCENLRYVDLSSSLEKLGDNAFLNCASLDDITIPKTLKETNQWYPPFSECSSLKNVTIEDGITKIPAGLFKFCDGLERITIPATVTEIGEEAFQDCENLKEVVLPDTVTTIGSDAFGGCLSLTTINLPKSLNKLGNGAFTNCTSLESITIPKALKEANPWYPPFTSCSSLKNVTFEDGRTKIPAGLFKNCDGLEKITIPATVTEIENEAFQDCENLKEVVFPDTVITIGAYAFNNCSNLTTVNIPKYLNKLGDNAFSYCTSLDNITIPKTLKEVNSWYSPFSFCSSLKNITIEDGMTKIPAGLFKNCDGLVKIAIPDSVTEIGEEAFQECIALKEVNLPKDLSVIAKQLFYGCAALESIDIHSNITKIDELAFGKSGLTELIIPDSVTEMNGSICFECASLKKVRLPKDLTVIPAAMFNGCTALNDIVLPDTIKEIGANAFTECTALEEIILPEGLEEISNSAFSGSGLKKVEVPKTVTMISLYAFQECQKLESAIINSGQVGSRAFYNCDSLTKAEINATADVGDYIFYDCDALESVTIGDKVTTIRQYFCYDCDSLTDVKLGTGVTTIEENAFSLCQSLKTITIPRFVTTIEDYAFSENVGLTSVYIPASVTSIGDTAFSYPYLMTIYGKSGSYAEEYANNWEFKFEAVDAPLTTLSYPEKEIKIADFKTFIPDMNFAPEFDTDTVTFTSSDSSIVSVSSNGEFFGNDYGTTTVAMTAESGLSDTITVTVVLPASTLSLNKTILDLPMGTNEDLALTIYPTNSTDDIVWTSDNNAVAIVDNKGRITALSEGTANITAKAVFGNRTATCLVTVVPSDVEIVDTTGIELGESECEVIVGNKYPIKANVLPVNATNKVVEWTTSDSNIATVENGVVTAKAVGNVTITATTLSGGFTASCEVTVVPKVEITSFTVQSFGPSAFLNLAAVNAPSEAIVYFAAYDADGRLLEIQKQALTNGAASYILSTVNVDKYKAFIWKGNKPASEPKEYEL